jgi:hypothetical protein
VGLLRASPAYFKGTIIVMGLVGRLVWLGQAVV